jgi:hypothetical protein
MLMAKFGAKNVIVSNVLKNQNCWRHNDFSETAIMRGKPISVGNQLGMIQDSVQLGSKLVAKIGTSLTLS